MDIITAVTDTYYGRQSGDVVVLRQDIRERTGWIAARAGAEFVVVTVLASDGSRYGTRYLLRSPRSTDALPVQATGMDLQEN